MPTHRFAFRFAALALVLSSCVGPDDSADEEDVNAEQAALDEKDPGGPTQEQIDEANDQDPEVVIGACYHGATTEVVAVDPQAPRCDLGQLEKLVTWAIEYEQWDLVAFFDRLDKNALIQCRMVEDVKGEQQWCADVIDRHPDGNPLVEGTDFGLDARNYFVAYAPDGESAEERPYWDGMLTDPQWTLPPVELSETGFILYDDSYVREYSGDVYYRKTRLLKFDPRDCTSCGKYAGPGIEYITNEGLVDVSTGWWPSIAVNSCNIWNQKYNGAWEHMGSEVCEAELVYRANSR